MQAGNSHRRRDLAGRHARRGRRTTRRAASRCSTRRHARAGRRHPGDIGAAASARKVVGLVDAARPALRVQPVRCRRDLDRRPCRSARSRASSSFADIGKPALRRRWSRPTAATTSPACSARTAWRCSICGIPSAARSASSTATAAARRSCRSTRCRTCAAGRSPGGTPTCPRSAATKCWWSTRASWQEVGRIAVAGQPVFVDGAARRPAGVGQLRAARQRHACRSSTPMTLQRRAHARAGQGGAAHGIHAARRSGVDLARATTIACSIYDTATLRRPLGELPVDKPSGIFFTSRATRIGF